MEAISKKLEAQDVASLLFNGVVCDFCKQAHESGACLSASLELFEEKKINGCLYKAKNESLLQQL